MRALLYTIAVLMMCTSVYGFIRYSDPMYHVASVSEREGDETGKASKQESGNTEEPPVPATFGVTRH